MRHIILAALGAIVALPVTIGPHGADPELYVLGITAAFSAGAFYAHAKILEKHTAEHFGSIREQLRKLTTAVEGLAGDASALRSSAEGWRGRLDATVEAQDRRITALERNRLEAAA